MNLKIHDIILLILLFARLGVSARSSKLSYDSHSPGGGGGYSLIRAWWGRAASQGMFFGIFVLKRVSILSFFVLVRVSILSIFVLNRGPFLGR